MSLESAIRQYLDADTGIHAAIAGRLFPVTLPRTPTYPCARYAVISKVRDVAFAGYTGLCMARIQIDVFSPEFDAAKAIMDKIRVRLCGSAEAANPWPSSIGTPAVDVQGVFIDGDTDGYEGADDGFDAAAEAPVGVYSSSADFLVWHKEPAA
ncbi:MAG: DUF3168 domain-containing protein [Phycisphaerales bacterium]|nr:DUF3168 domain-containing protein [Phycisphaerales bacterium]